MKTMLQNFTNDIIYNERKYQINHKEHKYLQFIQYNSTYGEDRSMNKMGETKNILRNTVHV